MLRILAGTSIDGEGFLDLQEQQWTQEAQTLLKISPKNKSCYRCNRYNYQADEYHYKDVISNFCKKKGHIETACILKKRKQKMGSITAE